MDEYHGGSKVLLATRKAEQTQQLEQVGKGLRKMMTFLRKKKEEGVPQEAAAAQ